MHVIYCPITYTDTYETVQMKLIHMIYSSSVCVRTNLSSYDFFFIVGETTVLLHIHIINNCARILFTAKISSERRFSGSKENKGVKIADSVILSLFMCVHVMAQHCPRPLAPEVELYFQTDSE